VTLADVLVKSSENILDLVLERNLAEAQIYIEMEDAELQRQSKLLRAPGFLMLRDESDFTNEEDN